MKLRQHSNFIQRTINLADDVNYVLLEHPDLDLAQHRFEPSDQNKKNCFIQPATKSQNQPHRILSCHGNLAKVFSVSASAGIRLESSFQILDQPKKLNLSGFGKVTWAYKEFIHSPETKRTIVRTKLKNVHDKAVVHFQEINLGDTRVRKGIRLLQSRLFDRETLMDRQLMLISSPSPRIMVKNCLLVRQGFEVIQTYLSSKHRRRQPQILSKIRHGNLETIFYDQKIRYNESQKKLFARLMGYSWLTWNNSFDYLINRVEDLPTKNVDQRFYCLVFNLQKLLTIIKVYDKLRRRIVKVITVNPARILSAVLKQKGLLSERNQVKDAKLADFDILTDSATLEGKIYIKDRKKGLDGFCDFKIVAQNCLLNKKDVVCALTISNQKDSKIHQGCFGNADYILSKTKKVNEKLAVVKGKGGLRETEVAVFLNQKGSHMSRLTPVKEIGLLSRSKVFFMDDRFLYIYDAQREGIKQRQRYSTFPNRVQMDKQNKLCYVIFGKFDPETNTIELFRMNKGRIDDLGDINLADLLKKKLKKKARSLSRPIEVKMAESARGLISILGYASLDAEVVTPRHKKDEYIMVIYIDKDYQQVVGSSVINAETVKHFKFQKVPLSEWRYRKKSEFWYFNRIIRLKKLPKKLVQLRIGAKSLEKVVQKKVGGTEAVDKIIAETEVKQFHLYEKRLYLDSHGGRSRKHQLISFKNPGTAQNPKLKKTGSIALSSRPYHFLEDSNDNLRVFLTKKQSFDSAPKIYITDADLLMTHRIELEELPVGIPTSMANVGPLCVVLSGERLLIRVCNWIEEESFAGLIYLVELGVGRIGFTGFRESGTGGNNQDGGQLEMGLWDDGFLVLSSYQYSLLY